MVEIYDEATPVDRESWGTYAEARKYRWVGPKAPARLLDLLWGVDTTTGRLRAFSEDRVLQAYPEGGKVWTLRLASGGNCRIRVLGDWE